MTFLIWVQNFLGLEEPPQETPSPPDLGYVTLEDIAEKERVAAARLAETRENTQRLLETIAKSDIMETK